jgi:magnesium transporter
VSDIMRKDFRRVPVAMDQEEVALLFRQYGLVAAPVVAEDDRLLGVITVDDVVDVIDEEAEEDLMRLGGVSGGALHGSPWRTARSRFPWLFINLGTAFVAASVIGLFEATIEKVVALAVLMPICASMGGNAGTQALTVAVRALAMRDLTSRNAAKFVARESMVGALNGMMFAVLVGSVSIAWFGDFEIAAIIAMAMLLNLIVAGLVGTLIPLGLDRFKIDPAVASSVFLTTITDVVGFFAFLGLATLVLM